MVEYFIHQPTKMVTIELVNCLKSQAQGGVTPSADFDPDGLSEIRLGGIRRWYRAVIREFSNRNNFCC